MTTLVQLLRKVEGFVVGGAVRDMALGRTPHDFDVVTPLTPEEIRLVVDVAYDVGEKFGTLAIQTSDAGLVEVTTMRKDITRGRKPDVVWTTSLDEDLARRDFTINTLFMEDTFCIQGSILAIEDLNNGIIRCVGSAHDRLAEDPLRALRALRFAVQLDFDIDAQLDQELRSMSLKIGSELSVERVMSEFAKMVVINPCKSMNLLKEYDFIKEIFPEIISFEECLHDLKWHKSGNLWNHTLGVMNRAPRTFIHQMCALYHDVGKPAVRNGTKYYGHDEAGARMIPAIAERLKLSNGIASAMTDVCRHHMKLHRIEEMRAFKRRQLYDNINWEYIYDIHIADSVSRATIDHFKWIEDDYKNLIGVGLPIITGYEIMGYGIIGQEIGYYKNRCFEAQLQGEFNDYESGIVYLKSILKG